MEKIKAAKYDSEIGFQSYSLLRKKRISISQNGTLLEMKRMSLSAAQTELSKLK